MNRTWKLQDSLRRALIAGALLALLAAPASAALTETKTFKSDRLVVRNLVGEVRIEPYRGSGFEVEVTVKGADAKDGMIELDADDETLNIRFPEARDFVYPALGRSNTRINGRDSDWLSKVGVHRRVDVSGSGRGVEIWADVVIRAPRGHELRVQHAVGELIAENVDADLELSTRNGNVTLEGTRGRVEVATGSGDVMARRVEGDGAEIATGSGDVEAEDCAAERFSIATGSGDVSVANLDGRRLQVATGSGDVTARDVAAEEANFATGSGKVTASFTRVGDGDFNFGTGSGNIILTLPGGVSAEVHAETNDGEIDIALDDAGRYSVREDDEVRLTLGNGDAKIDLGTGSGDIRIRN